MSPVGIPFLTVMVCCHAVAVIGQTREAVDMGVGMVKPNISTEEPLYFYGPPANNPFGDALTPVDSVTFSEGQYYIDIATAPPWLEPEVLKLDYDLMYFRAISIRRHWVEVIVNNTTGQTAWVNRQNVEYSDWSHFLLNVFSVDPTSMVANPVRVRPLEKADPVRQEAEALYPLTIRGSWMQVMLDMDGEHTGWIKWRDENRLLVTFSLLS